MTTSILLQACWHASRLATASEITACVLGTISQREVVFMSARRNVYCSAVERKNAEPIPPAAPVNKILLRKMDRCTVMLLLSFHCSCSAIIIANEQHI